MKHQAVQASAVQKLSDTAKSIAEAYWDFFATLKLDWIADSWGKDEDEVKNEAGRKAAFNLFKKIINTPNFGDFAAYLDEMFGFNPDANETKETINLLYNLAMGKDDAVLNSCKILVSVDEEDLKAQLGNYYKQKFEEYCAEKFPEFCVANDNTPSTNCMPEDAKSLAQKHPDQSHP